MRLFLIFLILLPIRAIMPPISKRAQRHFAARKKSTAAKATLALSKVNKLERSIELKHSDLNTTGEVLDAGVEVRFDNVSQGVTDVTRVGTRIMPKGLQVRIRLDWDAASTKSAFQCRLIFVQCKTAIAQNVPQIENVIDLSTSTLETLALYKWEDSQQYRILKDVVVDLGEIGGEKVERTMIFTIPAKKLREIRYTAGANTTESGNLGLIMVSNEVSVGPVFTIAARLLFTDL